MSTSSLRAITDGVVVIRAPVPGDAALLVAGRDDVFRRFMGPGSDEPAPTGCILVAGEVVGWVDHEVGHEWLEPGEVNVGYNVFAPHRGRGYATRAVQLLMHHLALDGTHRKTSLVIDADNERSRALAARARFVPAGAVGGNPFFRRSVPPLVYDDGVVTIRRPTVEDLDGDLTAKDDQQIDWMWEPGERASWEAMTAQEQRAHAARGLEDRAATFGTGPKWTFTVTSAAGRYLGYVDCDLANRHVASGEANISYATHPAHRRRGHATRAVRLVTRFLRDHTGARQAHVIVDSENGPSLRIAAGVGAVATERWVDGRGRTMIRHIADLSSTA